jgi:hypothetical protein
VLAQPASEAAELLPGTADEAGILGWSTRSFEGKTDYRATVIDGRKAIEAVSRASASALLHQGEINLERTPWLEWSWRIANRLDGVDERTREGDDYPARVYVLFQGHWLDPRPLALSYVWSNHQKAGSHWPSAYSDRVVMVALRGADDPLDQWLDERRNLADDIDQFFGRSVDAIGAVAIMSDSDNSAGMIKAWYGEIRVSSDGSVAGQ